MSDDNKNNNKKPELWKKIGLETSRFGSNNFEKSINSSIKDQATKIINSTTSDMKKTAIETSTGGNNKK